MWFVQAATGNRIRPVPELPVRFGLTEVIKLHEEGPGPGAALGWGSYGSPSAKKRVDAVGFWEQGGWEPPGREAGGC